MSSSARTRCWISPSPEVTAAAARALVAVCAEARRDEAFVVGLRGDLGAGKTVFAKGLGEGFGYEAGQLASPTFAIASAYPVPGGDEFVHVDVYRLEHAGELASAGFEDWLEPGNLVAIEWADRFASALPPDRLDVSIERCAAGLAPGAQFGEDSGLADPGAQARRLEVRALGPLATAVLQAWEQALKGVAGLEVEDRVESGGEREREPDGERRSG